MELAVLRRHFRLLASKKGCGQGDVQTGSLMLAQLPLLWTQHFLCLSRILSKQALHLFTVFGLMRRFASSWWTSVPRWLDE